MCCIPLLPSVFFQWSHCPRFGQWDPLKADFCILLTCPHPFLRASLSSGKKRSSRFILYFSCSSFRTSHFCSDPRILLVENSIWKPRSGHSLCSLLLRCQCSSSIPSDRSGKYMCVLTINTCTPITVHSCPFICNTHEFIPVLPIPVLFQSFSSFSVLHLYTYFLQFFLCSA